MADIVNFSQLQTKKIDVTQLKVNTRKLSDGLISQSTKQVEYEIAPEHSAEPIKNLSDITRVSQYLVQNGRYRDNMLFIVGINFGLRVSDLHVLRFSNLINDNLVFKDKFAVFEKKTRNTRKRKKNRYITINNAVVEAVTLYLEHTKGVSLDDYMFTTQFDSPWRKSEPLTTRRINQILKGIETDLNLGIRMSSHTLRKTFCYHQMLMSHNDDRKLLLLQKMLGHSSPAQTLDYIGITSEEIEDAYNKLNLGGSQCYDIMASNIIELDQAQ